MRHLLSLVLLASVLAAPRASAAEDDPRWVFYTRDTTAYTSPWFAQAHRILIPFGCTPAPYYSPDSRCRDGRGFHHGIDIAMPCGTPLTARRRFRVVDPSGLGPAYGARPLRLRNAARGWDLVVGHAQEVMVQPGDRVRKGTVFALAGDSGAPDGCHLHFEKRAVGGELSTARHPRRLLALTPSS